MTSSTNPVATNSSSSNTNGRLIKFVRNVGGKVKTSLAIVGTAALVGTYLEYKRLNPTDPTKKNNNKYFTSKEGNTNDTSSQKGKILVIPFHRLNIVERDDDDTFASRFKGFDKLRPKDDDEIITIPVQELVTMIHTAASDPSITALYGIFGHGSTSIASTGWGDLEEIRNALRVFRESHRRHMEPNLLHQVQVIPRVNAKPMYAYADTFSSLSDPSNKEYYIASIFSDIHLQQHGELNLFGPISQTFFFRNFLEKYGIQVHVMKHGNYKNFPNILTHNTYNKFHYENIATLLNDINFNVTSDITRSRSKALLTQWLDPSKKQKNKKNNKSTQNPVKRTATEQENYQRDLWKRIYESGTFPAVTAWRAGFIDYIPHRDPLVDLIQNNVEKNQTKKQQQQQNEDGGTATTSKLTSSTHTTKNEASTNGNGFIAGDAITSTTTNGTKVSSLWNVQETDFAKFPATDSISLKQYRKQLQQKKSITQRKEMWKKVADQYPSTLKPMLQSIGFLPESEASEAAPTKDFKKKDKIAVLQVHGAIGDDAARKLVNSIRKIRTDDQVKCVVVRVSSPGGSIVPCETISQELKSLNVPTVVSFGNVAASGGYYISANADRIFALEKTITGSIGVFGIRLDLTGLAQKYGINAQHISTSNLSGSYSMFQPMNKQQKQNLSDSIDRYYDQFKDIVTTGRNLPTTYVEALAGGRVYTGTQAKYNGLIDEIGGYHRAIAHAKRTYTPAAKDEDDVIVEVWPKKTSLFEQFMGSKDSKEMWHVAYDYVSDAVKQSGLYSAQNTTTSSQSVALTESLTGALVDYVLRSAASSGGPVSPSLGGIYMTADDTTAFQLLLSEVAVVGNPNGYAGVSNNNNLPPLILPRHFWE